MAANVHCESSRQLDLHSPIPPPFYCQTEKKTVFMVISGLFLVYFYCTILAGELCTSACRVCTARASLCSAVMWRFLITHSIHLFLLHFSSRTSPCAITFQLDSKTKFIVLAAGILKLKGIRLLTAGSVLQRKPRVLTFFVLNAAAVRQFYIVKYLNIFMFSSR
jgi:hypothetical protein